MPRLINELTQLTKKWVQSIESIHGEQGGLSTINVRRLRMWTNHKMTSKTLIHNDDVTCFHMVVQGTQKMVMMGDINFEDQALIKTKWVGKKRMPQMKSSNMKKRHNH